MSFTRQVKNELVRYSRMEACCRSWELAALLLLRGCLAHKNGQPVLGIRLEHSALARLLFILLKAAGIDNPAVTRRRERRKGKICYEVEVTGADQVEALLLYLGLKKAGRGRLACARRAAISRRCCRRAFIRGAFLAGGSISVATSSGYHLEINCSRQENAAFLKELLGGFSLDPLLRQHNGSYSLYLKNAEAIADFLRIVGAGGALLHLESARVVKSMRNRVNRLVNCDTANLEKTVTSARQQLDLIERIDRRVGLAQLPPSLREAARLRRCYPEASLKELGEMLDPPLGKSGMNHRFRRLARLAKKWG